MLNFDSRLRRFVRATGLGGVALGAVALGGLTAAAGPAPTISPLHVQAGGHEATITVSTSVPTAISYANRPVTAAPPIAQPVTPPATSPITSRIPGAGIVGELVDGQIFRQYLTSHQIKLTGLKSNTAYDLSVVAETQSGQKVTAQTRFTTLKQRVRITLREINITDDGDGFLTGDGEPSWVVKLSWAGGSVAGCYPNTDVGFGGVCQFDSRGSGRFVPTNNRGDSLTWIFAQENFDQFPAEFQIGATAKEDDFLSLGALTQIFEDCILDGIGCGFENTVGPGPWKVPQDVEWASTAVRVRANDSGTGFESELTFTFDLFHDNLSYPSQRNAPSSTWRAPFGR